MNNRPNYSRAIAYMLAAVIAAAAWVAVVKPALQHGADRRAAAERTLDH